MTESIKANNKNSGNAITSRESEKMLKKLNNLKAECVKFTADLKHNFHALRLMIWENTGSSQILTLSWENGAEEFMQNLSRITEAENPDMAVLLQQGLQEMQNANTLFLKKNPKRCLCGDQRIPSKSGYDRARRMSALSAVSLRTIKKRETENAP